MGTMTRDEIKTEVIANLDNRNDVTDAQAARWINHTYHHLTHPSVHPFEDLAVTFDITLVSGTASYSLEAATVGYRVLAIRSASYFAAASASIVPNTRSRRLTLRPIEWYDGRSHPTVTEPSSYVIGEDQTMLISDTPGNTNTVRVRAFREAASLSLGTSKTVLPEAFDDVLVTGSQARFEFKLGDRDRANETFQLYNSMISSFAPKELLESQNWGIQTSLSSAPAMRTS